MNTDADLLTLMQWVSPAFPLGAFAYSHGLEAAVAECWVTDAPSLQAWLAATLTQGSGRADAIWLQEGYRAVDGAAVLALNAQALAFVPAKTRRDEASKQGAAFARVVRDVWALEVPDVVLPLAVSHAARQQGIAVTRVVPLYLQSFAGNIISAAQRLMPLGQTGAQRVMRNMQPVIQTLAADTAEARLDDLYSNAFLSDIAAMRQEHLEVRVFQS